MTPTELRQLARRGAEARLLELQREVEAIRQMFPDLRPEVASGGSSVRIAQRTGRPGRMSQAQRRAVSERMKRYWASRKGQDGNDSASTLARRGRRKMSAAARKRIGEAQRKRWAELKAKQAVTRKAPNASAAQRQRTTASAKKR